jgi:hypothetical protein
MYSSSTTSAEIAAMHGMTIQPDRRQRRQRKTTNASTTSTHIKKGAVKITPVDAPRAKNTKHSPSHPADVCIFSASGGGGYENRVESLGRPKSSPITTSKKTAEAVRRPVQIKQNNYILPLSQYLANMQLGGQRKLSNADDEEYESLINNMSPLIPNDVRSTTPSLEASLNIASPSSISLISQQQEHEAKHDTGLDNALGAQPAEWSSAILKIFKADESLHDLNLFCKELAEQLYSVRLSLDTVQNQLKKAEARQEADAKIISELTAEVKDLRKWQDVVDDTEQLFDLEYVPNDDDDDDDEECEEADEGDEGEYDEGDFSDDEGDEEEGDLCESDDADEGEEVEDEGEEVEDEGEEVEDEDEEVEDEGEDVEDEDEEVKEDEVKEDVACNIDGFCPLNVTSTPDRKSKSSSTPRVLRTRKPKSKADSKD